MIGIGKNQDYCVTRGKSVFCHQVLCDFAKNVKKHLIGQSLGVSIISRTMIRTEKPKIWSYFEVSTVENLYFVFVKLNAVKVALCAISPRVIIAFILGMLDISCFKKTLQAAISAPIGLFSGGRQRTAFVIRQLFSLRPSLDSPAYLP